ncbi:MAG: FliH/SctL family protein [Pseudomonadales bacterium]
MTTVIVSPVIREGTRRSLPVADGHNLSSDPLYSGFADNRGHSANPDSCSQGEALDIGYLEQIMAERDVGLTRAEQAEKMLSALQENLAQAEHDAREQGYRAGITQAKDEIKDQQTEDTNAIRTLLDNLTQEKTQLIRQAEEAALEIAFSATAKFLGTMNTDKKMLESLVKEAMGQVLQREGLVVYLTPSDCQRMEQCMQQPARSQSRDWVGVEFKSDANIQLGGCRVESRSGSLDARLELQITALKKLLMCTQPSRVMKGHAMGGNC